ncbi:hypothetical protein JCM19231_1553 [Vibrio ishigakensis]|uniref:Uncharacterized protein n=1 Tax=Vibrio ishigakensis TaxID=1481914 RepID=A0A0B8P0R8_9VIBR|nr:hypothetical protein [Vibrio ishigakensis]GAM58172.1 hypothetical protein JCM19231_1553 [Vibrio ishigakensis]
MTKLFIEAGMHELYTTEEMLQIEDLFENCGHRAELKNTLMNIYIYNYTVDVNPELGSLLRYMTKHQLAGLITIMRMFGSHFYELYEILPPKYHDIMFK